MSKISIVSRPDQHLLIDINGCLSFKEALEQLSATLLSANQFWQGTTVDLNLGKLLLSKTQLTQIMALTKGVGICARHVFAENPETIKSLKELAGVFAIAVNKDVPPQLSSVAVLADNNERSSAPQAGEYGQHIESNSLSNKTNMQFDVDANIEPMALFEDMDISTTAKENEPAGSEMITCADSLPVNNGFYDQKQSTAASATQNETSPGKQPSLYIKQTLRAGQAVSHEGDLIIIGDVNAGAEVLAVGDITVWGSLRGIAHAGVGGNTQAEIRALRLQPIQLRIAHYIARSPDALLTANSILSAPSFMAETAKLVNGKIRILRETFD